MSANPADFNLVLQTHSPGAYRQCQGIVAAPVHVPTRVVVTGNADVHLKVAALKAALWKEFSALGSQATGCNGPGLFRCMIPRNPAARTLVVFVAGPTLLHAQIRNDLGPWLGSSICLVPDSDDPQLVLPPDLKSNVALRYSADLCELVPELIDLVTLAGEERRAFISYAHNDGVHAAEALFAELGKRRFDVFLDRFRTPPGHDFVQRIHDELQNKTMVVVVETPGAVASPWVQHEVAAAIQRRYGLLAVNLDPAHSFASIPDSRRAQVNPPYGPPDIQAVCARIEEEYRRAVVDQKRRRDRSIDLALQLARGVRPPLPGRVPAPGQPWKIDDGPRTYSLLPRIRPADLRDARIATEGAPQGAYPVIYSPRSATKARQADERFLHKDTPVTLIPDGRLLEAARRMVGGVL
jgi:hypothetical protein